MATLAKERQRIGHYIESPAVGGAERIIASLVRHLNSSYSSVVLCPTSPEIEPAREEWRAAGARVVSDPRIFIFGKHRPADLLHKALLFRQLKLSLIHLHLLGKECLYAYLAARLAGIPTIVLSQHNEPYTTYSGFRRRLSGWVAATADAVTVNAYHVRGQYVSKFGWPEEKIEVIHCGIDSDRFSAAATPGREQAKRRFGLSDDSVVLVGTGRLVSIKGFEFALRALPLIQKAHPDTIFLLAGQGKEHEPLRRLAESLGIESSVRFLGFRNDIPNIVAAADLVVVPSLIEPFGLVVAEAMALEKPVIASHVGGIPEVLGEDGEAGSLVPPGQPDAIAREALFYLSNSHAARQAGVQVRKRVLERFTLRHFGTAMEAVYRRLLEPGQSPLPESHSPLMEQSK